MHLTTIEEVKDYGNAFSSNEDLLTNNISNNEILQLLEKYLVGEDRATFIKIKAGAKVSKTDTDKLVKKLQQIISNHG
jgi:hypothetical protein